MNSRLRPLIFSLFFFSGATSLVYQVIWTRQMTLVFGISVYAVTTVLTSFMAGLALGSFCLGRVADRSRRLLYLYGLLEIGIGLFALLFPWIMNLLEPLFVLIYRNFYVNYTVFSLIRFAIIFLVLLVPTFLMGGTLPILSRYFIRSRASVGRDVGFLYGVNTTGAVAGTFLVGFVLIANLGLWRSILIAAAVNLVIGAISVLIGRREEAQGSASQTHAEPAEPPLPRRAELSAELSPATVNLVLVAIGMSGFAALGFEVLWTRVLVLYVHNSTYAFSSMLGVFLFGLATGGWFFGAVAHRIRRPLIVFALLELGIGAWAVLSLFILGELPALTQRAAAVIQANNWYEAMALIVAQASIVLYIPTFLMGITLPLATRLVTTNLSGIGRKIGNVFAVNTLGTVFGSFVVGFVLIPIVGVRNSFILVAALNFLIAAMLLGAAPLLAPPLKWVGVSFCLGFVLLSQIAVPRDIVFKRFAEAFGEIVYYKEEVTDTILVADVDGTWERRTLIYADGRGTAGHWTRMEDRFYGHLPVLLHKAPKDVLVICFGAGNTVAAIGTHKEIEKIDCVELSPGVIAASEYFDTNNDILSDERVTLYVEDGRNYLLGTEKTYDIIHLDPPELHTAGVINLYTEEFYELCRKRLREGGVMSHWFNATKMEDDEQRMIVGTFARAFRYTQVWQGPGMYSFNLIGSDRPLRVPLKRVAERLAMPAVTENLEEFGLQDPLSFFSLLLMKNETVQAYTAGAPSIRDDRTIIDYSNPKSIHSSYGLVNILSATRPLEEHLDTNPYTSTAAKFGGGGLRRLVELTQQTDYAGDIIDWEGFTPEERFEAEALLREKIEKRKNLMAGYVKQAGGAAGP